MMSNLTKAQLFAFVVVTVSALVYGAITLFDFGSIVRPPYQVEVQFTAPGGIHPRADVDLLGTRVGKVVEVRPGPDSATTVVVAIDQDVRISTDVDATISSKSAIGEPYVALTPRSEDGPMLADGDTISLDRTTAPPDFAELLTNVAGLAESIPLRDLATTLDELALAVNGVGPDLGRLIDSSQTITEASLDNVESLISLIDNARTVLDTQVEVGPETTVYLQELAGLTDRLRDLDPTFEQVFANGITAGTEVTNLLSANQDAIPLLLNNLLTITAVASDRVPALRKTLAVFPWVLEIGANGVRYCDEYDERTGVAVESTCHYDENGDPIYAAYLALQLPELPGSPPYQTCTKGYGGTQRYLPDGTKLGGGARQGMDSEPNPDAGCRASPTDPFSPNVRGAQNAHQRAGDGLNRPGTALLNPTSGVLATPDGSYRLTNLTAGPPPAGREGLAWLLVQPLAGEE
ncbi:MlaD family protein [Nocardioides sp. WS12]|uniref:MCE family protein n=1 Tax=Nocardioides sp. WS12 TaxID=2486272 RepID=UPI0015F7A0F5|nr:MlaD family protein [Nocardioides sp. WS12]